MTAIADAPEPTNAATRTDRAARRGLHRLENALLNAVIGVGLWLVFGAPVINSATLIGWALIATALYLLVRGTTDLVTARRDVLRAHRRKS